MLNFPLVQKLHWMCQASAGTSGTQNACLPSVLSGCVHLFLHLFRPGTVHIKPNQLKLNFPSENYPFGMIGTYFVDMFNQPVERSLENVHP